MHSIWELFIYDQQSCILRIAEHNCSSSEEYKMEENLSSTYLKFSMRLTIVSSYFSNSGGDAFFFLLLMSITVIALSTCPFCRWTKKWRCQSINEPSGFLVCPCLRRVAITNVCITPPILQFSTDISNTICDPPECNTAFFCTTMHPSWAQWSPHVCIWGCSSASVWVLPSLFTFYNNDYDVPCILLYPPHCITTHYLYSQWQLLILCPSTTSHSAHLLPLFIHVYWQGAHLWHKWLSLMTSKSRTEWYRRNGNQKISERCWPSATLLAEDS